MLNFKSLLKPIFDAIGLHLILQIYLLCIYEIIFLGLALSLIFPLLYKALHVAKLRGLEKILYLFYGRLSVVVGLILALVNFYFYVIPNPLLPTNVPFNIYTLIFFFSLFLGFFLFIGSPQSSGMVMLFILFIGIVWRTLHLTYFQISGPYPCQIRIVQNAFPYLLKGVNPYETYQSYLPGVLLSYLPYYVLGVDIRYANVIADSVVFSLLYYMLIKTSNEHVYFKTHYETKDKIIRNDLALASLVIFFFSPMSLNLAWYGEVQPYWMYLFASLFLFKLEKMQWSAIFFGLSLASRPFATILTPFLLMFLIRKNKERAVRFAIITLLTAVAIVLPFFLWNPSAFMGDYGPIGQVSVFNENALAYEAFENLDYPVTTEMGINILFFHYNIETYLVIIEIALLVFTYYFTYKKMRGMSDCFSYMALTYFLVLIFSPLSHAHYFIPPILICFFLLIES